MEYWRQGEWLDESSDEEDDKLAQDDNNEDMNEMDGNDTCKFSTNKVFHSREELINWVQSVGFSLGYTIVIKRSVKSSSGKIPRIVFQCDRGGIYKSNKISTRHTGTKKIGCPFELEGNFLRIGDCWSLNVICELHNHDAALHMDGHPYSRRLSGDEVRLVEDLSKKNVKPRDILTIVKQQNPDNVSIIKNIYNARHKLRTVEKGGKTQMQVVMDFLQKNEYVFEFRTNESTNELEDLFFAHPKSLEIWRAFPHVLLIDATYKTNRYKMPLLEIVGVTSTNMTFCIAFVFMHSETESSYTWALRCLRTTMYGCTAPRVIVTDRALALMKACNNVFPEAKGLPCRWHINQNILKKCRPSLKSMESWNSFYKAWNMLVESETEEGYLFNLKQLEATLLDFSGVLSYVNANWLIPYKEMFVAAWTDKFLNFGNHTTNRVESQHAKLKKYLDSPRSDLERSLSYIHEVVDSQVISIQGSLEQNKIVIRHRFNTPLFRELLGFVSTYALDIMFKEFERSKVKGFFSKKCGCQLRTSHGLPCAHEQVEYFKGGRSIPLDAIDMFWRKLDLSPCTSLEDDDFGCEPELQMFKAQFKKKSRSDKFSFLRKLREIIAPSTTSVREPAIHKTCGRPSLKDTIFKKSHVDPHLPSKKPSRHGFSSARFVGVDPPVPTQKPSRHSCSSKRFVDLKNTQYTEPTRHSYSFDQQYSFHPFILQFSTIFHPYITQVHDVRSDGNCGFRAIAVCLGLHEDAWPAIRYELIEELNRFKDEYVEMFGIGGWFNVYNSLNFFESNRSAPPEHWITMPDMGVLVASKYNVMLHVLSISGSITYLPLRSNPPPSHQHVAIAIGHVNNNHYVKVTLTRGYPVPTITPQWIHFRHDCAAEWVTPYFDRINIYNEYLRVRSNCTSKFVVLD